MRELRFALKQTVPILFEYVFIGLSFGILMSDMGYSPLWSAFSALTIYAGSMQLVMISLFKAGTPLLTLVFTAFAVNARHIFYGKALLRSSAAGIVHLWKKNMYVSIIVGTVIYMVLIRTVFAV